MPEIDPFANERAFDDAERVPLASSQRETENLLLGLTPAMSGIDRNQLLFDAGRAAGRRERATSLWCWRAAAAVLMGGLMLSFMQKRENPSTVQLIVYRDPVDRPHPAMTAGGLPASDSVAISTSNAPWFSRVPTLTSDTNYLTLRNAVLARGIEAIDAPKKSVRRSEHESSPQSPRSSEPVEPTLGNLMRLGAKL